MRTTPLPTTPRRPGTRILLAGTAAMALALTGAACSGEGGAAQAGGSPEARSTAGAGGTEGTAASPGRLATAEFRVDGMTCGGCALATEMAVKKLDGVRSADAEYNEASGEGRCTVEYDPDRVTADRIAAAIEEAGFTPSPTSGPEGS